MPLKIFKFVAKFYESRGKKLMGLKSFLSQIQAITFLPPC